MSAIVARCLHCPTGGGVIDVFEPAGQVVSAGQVAGAWRPAWQGYCFQLRHWYVYANGTVISLRVNRDGFRYAQITT